MTTYVEAIDVMYAIFKSKWDSVVQSIVGYVPEVEYEGIVVSGKHDASKVWARLSVRPSIGLQSTIGSAHEQGKHEYTNYGILHIHLFLPRDKNKAILWGRTLAQEIQKAYRAVNTNGEVWFRNVTIKEGLTDDTWGIISITAEYEYTETA